MTPRAGSLALALSLVAHAADAEWLEIGSRGIARADSANPDAPVVGYAFGPRARASVGTDISLWAARREQKKFRLGGLCALSFEDAEGRRLFPEQLGRSAFALSASWWYERPFPALFPAELELGLELGRRAVFTLDGFELGDAYRVDDVPYGAGGIYLGFDAAMAAPIAPRLRAMSRVTLRAYANALPDAVGQTEASDHAASFLEEGAKASVALELGLRLDAAPQTKPVLQVYADVIAPHDDSAKTLWLVRALVGTALPGQHFELQPYLDAEAGHGQGLLVNRTQLRLGFGVRAHAR